MNKSLKTNFTRYLNEKEKEFNWIVKLEFYKLY